MNQDLINQNVRLYFENIFLKSQVNELMKDAKTGLWNMHASKLIADFLDKNANIPYSIIVIDIDNFKQINDTFTHILGDEVLVELSNKISSWTRKVFNRRTDILLDLENSRYFGLRFGGEEFILILIGEYKENILVKMVEELRILISENVFEVMNKKIKISCSFGVTIKNRNLSFKQNLLLADQALLKAKKNGKNRVELSVQKVKIKS